MSPITLVIEVMLKIDSENLFWFVRKCHLILLNGKFEGGVVGKRGKS